MFSRLPAFIGLSPRMRGTVNFRRLAEDKTRFIPADAGNGPLLSLQEKPHAVYPRGCGERKTAVQDFYQANGLSPRMRGTGLSIGGTYRDWRFIPADAGNGDVSSRICILNPVYPRGCGERTAPMPLACSVNGLSPRMRGTGTGLSWVCLHTRFIPADAGNGPVATSDYARSPVYPRGCGERPSFRFGPYSLNGLSPRMRGTEADDIAMFLKARFIPADAGNSETLMLNRGLSAVYPRG